MAEPSRVRQYGVPSGPPGSQLPSASVRPRMLAAAASAGGICLIVATAGLPAVRFAYGNQGLHVVVDTTGVIVGSLVASAAGRAASTTSTTAPPRYEWWRRTEVGRPAAGVSAPHGASGPGDEAELGPFVVYREGVAEDRGGEPALRGNCQPFEGDV